MKTFIRDSIRIINANLIYIPFLALSSIFIISPVITRFSFVFLVLSFIFFPVVYGRLIEIVFNLPITSAYKLLKTHWFNYLSVFMFLGIPVFVLSFLYSSVQGFQKIIIKNVIDTVILCLAIYIWPLVFIKKKVLSPILTGITILFQNILLSIPLILLTVIIVIMKIMVQILILYISPVKPSTIFGIFFLQNIINVYIFLLIFTSATMLIKSKNINH
ncbi:MAG: hypothetical protein ACXADW_19460 [Candidatus Hodarchaeales archaeon]|jgi:hypothetical protein